MESTASRLFVGTHDECGPECHELVHREYDPPSFYAKPAHPLSIVDLPAGTSTSRYNARRCRRLGYYHAIIDRAQWEDDLFELRSSAQERQGRSMPLAYLERQSYQRDPHPEERCYRHRSVVHGVISDAGRLVAYAQVVQSGDVARVNTILGHDAFMRDGVVWLLVEEFLAWHATHGEASTGLYYTHNSGHGDGLRYFKERNGFYPATVEWER